MKGIKELGEMRVEELAEEYIQLYYYKPETMKEKLRKSITMSRILQRLSPEDMDLISSKINSEWGEEREGSD